MRGAGSTRDTEVNAHSDTSPSQTQTFRIPGTAYRLILPMLILGLLPVGFFVMPAMLPGPSRYLYIVVLGAVAFFLTRKYTWVIPRRVEVSPDGLRIVWLFRGRWVPARLITDAQLVLWETIQRPGAWSRDGLHGLWDSPELGPCEIYATAPANLAMVHLADAPPLLLGVEFPDELIEAIEADILGRNSLL